MAAMLTDREIKVVVNAWKFFDKQPKVDYKSLADLSKYKNAASAKSAWIAVKNKLDSGATNFTENDIKVLNLSWKCFKDQPKINYQKLAKEAGYKTSESARSCWFHIRKKLVGRSKKGGKTSIPKAKVKKGNNKRVRKTNTNDGLNEAQTASSEPATNDKETEQEPTYEGENVDEDFLNKIIYDLINGG